MQACLPRIITTTSISIVNMTSDAPYGLTEENLSTFAADTPLSPASEVAEPDDASPQPDLIEEEDDYTGIN